RQLLRQLVASIGIDPRRPDGLAASVPTGVLVLLGETLARAGEWKEASALLALAAHDPLGREGESLAAMLRMARDRLSTSGHGEALKLYRSLLDRAVDVEPRLRGRLLVDLSRSEASLGQRDQSIQSSTEALAAAVAAEDWALATEALISRHTLHLSSA